MKYTVLAQLGDWTFYEFTEHGFPSHDGSSLFGYEHVSDPGDPGKPKTGELYTSLDRAMIAAVGEKYTAPRGAGGAGVGTAADWFARMIGMDQLVPMEYGAARDAMTDALVATRPENGPISRRARAMITSLETKGFTIVGKMHP